MLCCRVWSLRCCCCWCCWSIFADPLLQSMAALAAEVDALHKQPSPLAAAQAAKQEVLADQRKFQEVIAGNQVCAGGQRCFCCHHSIIGRLCRAPITAMAYSWLPASSWPACRSRALCSTCPTTRPAAACSLLYRGITMCKAVCVHGHQQQAVPSVSPSADLHTYVSHALLCCRPSAAACRRSLRSDRPTWRPRKQPWLQCVQVGWWAGSLARQCCVLPLPTMLVVQQQQQQHSCCGCAGCQTRTSQASRVN